MTLRYQTGIAALIQFVALSFLGLANGLDSVVSTCRAQSSECVSNLIVSIIFFILTAAWFGAVWVLASLAQTKRSRRLAQLLIIAEGFIALIAVFDIKHHLDGLSIITSIIDLGLSIWVAILAFRLMRAKGGRIVKARLNRSNKD